MNVDSMRRLTTAIARAEREILEDLRAGRFTAEEITSFSDLHDYVDANEYGGLCDGDLDLDGEALMHFGNAVQGVVDLWIRSGCFARAAAA